ncbi:hypothetical protein GCM10027297_00610 [Parahaliea aestuarii]
MVPEETPNCVTTAGVYPPLTRLLSIVLLLTSLGMVTAPAASPAADWDGGLNAIGQESSNGSGSGDIPALDAPRSRPAEARVFLPPTVAPAPSLLKRALACPNIRAPPLFTA